MFWFGIAIFCIIVVAAGFLLWRTGKKQAENGKPAYDIIPAWVGMAVMGVGVAIFVILTAVSCFTVIGQREVGVVTTFGEITGQVGPGMQVILPWQDVYKQSTAIESYKVKNHEGFSMETQPVYYTATLNWHVEPQNVQTLYKTVGPNFFDRVIPTRLDQAFKSETVKYNATDIAPNREKIKENVLAELKRTLAVYAISADDLNIDNLFFSKEFQAAITEKQVAAQKALAAQNKVKQAEFEADQLIKAAEGKAEATKIEGEMLAKYPAVIQLRAIEKLNPNVSIMMVPSGANILFSPDILKAQAQQ